jgi:alcohol dehydrogenase class IV
MAEVMKDGLKLSIWPEAQPMDIAHVAVPTTAGTGAEVSAAAVFYNERNGLKCNMVAPFIEADFAVLDPEMTVSLPPHLTASTGMDAMTHALEAICSPIANPLTDAHAFTAAQLIERNLPIAVRNGQDLQARQDLLQASAMAINAFINALNAIPVHNCSHAFGGLYQVPHGEANCALLPIVMEAMPDFYRPQARRLAKALNMLVSENDDDGTVLGQVIARLRAFQDEIGGHRDFARFDITGADVPKIVKAIETDPAAVFYAMPRDSIQAIAEKVIGQ